MFCQSRVCSSNKSPGFLPRMRSGISQHGQFSVAKSWNKGLKMRKKSTLYFRSVREPGSSIMRRKPVRRDRRSGISTFPVMFPPLQISVRQMQRENSQQALPRSWLFIFLGPHSERYYFYMWTAPGGKDSVLFDLMQRCEETSLSLTQKRVGKTPLTLECWSNSICNCRYFTFILPATVMTARLLFHSSGPSLIIKPYVNVSQSKKEGSHQSCSLYSGQANSPVA